MQKLMTLSMIVSLSLAPILLQPARADDAADEATTRTGAAATGEATTEETATIGGFEDLSPGNKTIARALMDAQTLPADGEIQPWSLDDIAAARSETGWGNVFKQMQAEGLVETKNLGEVVSAHARATHQPVPENLLTDPGPATSGDPAGTDTGTTEESTGEDMTDTAMTEPPENVDGAFDQLSPGNKNIARALMEAQTLPADGTTQPWNLDQIAAARDTTGWGNVFKQMQTEGLVDAKNLGQVVSHYQHGGTMAVTAANTTIASTAAASPTERLPEQANGKAVGHTSHTVAAAGNANTGITTAAGTTANGNAHGLGKHAVSASDGITTADGAASSGAGGSAAALGANAAGHGAAAASVTTAAGSAAGNGHGYAYGRSK